MIDEAGELSPTATLEEDSTSVEVGGSQVAPESQIGRALMTELVRLRKKRKISQEPLAKAIGITQSRLSQIENLKGGPMSMDAFLLYAQTIGAEIVLLPAKKQRKE